MHSNRVVIPALLVVLMRATEAAAFQLSDPIPTPIPQGNITVQLVPVATGLVSPIYLTSAFDVSAGDEGGGPGPRSNKPGSSKLYVVDQTGKVLVMKGGVIQDMPLLDISDLLSNLSPPFPGVGPGLFPGYDERGLLGLAFHPNFADPGKPGFRTLYTMHNVPVGRAADFPQPPFPPTAVPNCQEVIAEWKTDATGEVVDPMSYRELLRYDKPEFNHNAGTIAFGPDRLLYASLGDGGNADDVGDGHIPGTGNAQTLGVILGKVIRINPLDPRRTGPGQGLISANGAYSIPRDNPFVATAGALKEIYAYGFRNPYRMSFDRLTGRLIVADVGQNNIEEVDIVRKGGNYGWHRKEGTFLFDPATEDVSIDPSPDPSLINPVVEYDHNPSETIRVPAYMAIIGGFVYHGSKIPELRGKYVCADLTGFLFYADLTTGKLAKLIDSGIFIKGFGQDPDGEIYALGSAREGPSGTAGVVLAIRSGTMKSEKGNR
jgi:hypothetical protein